MRRAGEHQGAVVVDLGEADAAVFLVDVHAEGAQLRQALDHVVGDAGVALDLLARARALLPGVEPLSLPAGASFPRLDDPDALLRFKRLVAEAQQAGQSDLERARAVFGLSVTELGGLFGVTRQAAGLWLAGGPPAARRAKAATVAAIADVLVRRLKPARIPGIARRHASEYGGETMLELIAADRHDWLLDSVRRSFDYAATA